HYVRALLRRTALGLLSVLSVANANADSTSEGWQSDAPGRVHRVDLNALPPPFKSASANNNPHVIAAPKGFHPRVPAGFTVGLFATDLEGPRRMLTAPNGEILLTQSELGRVAVLHPSADGTRAERVEVFAEGLRRPFGIALYPRGGAPQWLYVAETHRVIRYPYHLGGVHARGTPEVVIDSLPTGGHYTRDLAFSPDGRELFVSVGSASNVPENLTSKTPAEIREWEAAHGLGGAWDAEQNRADVLVFDAAHPGQPRVYAAGIRNCVGLTVQPVTGALWCTTNERDGLGDDLVPDYSTRVREGAFYGWPWYYMGAHEDPRLQGQRPDLRDKVQLPDVPFQAHSAPLCLTFYTATSGAAAFPSEYVGDAFVTLHGSWNRAQRTGHKLVRIHLKNGVPDGRYEDFMTGLIANDKDVWGRPVATTVAHDGALLVSDDGADVIYRIAYRPGSKTH
ncbi:MAG: PQQ-dependent sugar dehydrogenase, partial [Sinobacteraceae bacterium]|nr:PQQ-dependent sugar dehydrogenase [Nevskiaceae bacterium]